MSIQVKKVEICVLQIPFRFQYGHARQTHNSVSLIVCRAYDAHDRVGLGESVPRLYVTGETPSSVMEDLQKFIPLLLKAPVNFESLTKEIVNAADSWKGDFPSCALCALEGAVLDLLAQEQQLGMDQLFTKEKSKKFLRYTGSIGMGNSSLWLWKLLGYKLLGIQQFKIKVGTDQDEQRLKSVRNILGKSVRIYADANAVWTKEQAVRQIEMLEKYNVWAIEEPLKPVNDCDSREDTLNNRHYENYVWLKKRIGIPIIADESLISLSSLDKIIKYRAFDILNIRLSKCGGMILSHEMLRRALQKNIGYGIGAMVGETAILASRGAAFGLVHNDYKFIQGFSHPYLHEEQVMGSKLKIRYGGKVCIKQKKDLSIKVHENTFREVLVEKESVSL